MKLRFTAAILFFAFLSAPVFASNTDLSYTRKEGDITHMVLLNLSTNSIVIKGRKGNGPWKQFQSYRITSIDITSSYSRDTQTMLIKYNDGRGGNDYRLNFDLAKLQGSKFFYLNQSLTFSYNSRDRRYKYVIEPGAHKGYYYTSAGKNGPWQMLSEFKITNVKYEGQYFKGEPVFSVYFVSTKGVRNKLQVSTRWDKIAGPVNNWLNRSN